MWVTTPQMELVLCYAYEAIRHPLSVVTTFSNWRTEKWNILFCPANGLGVDNFVNWSLSSLWPYSSQKSSTWDKWEKKNSEWEKGYAINQFSFSQRIFRNSVRIVYRCRKSGASCVFFFVRWLPSMLSSSSAPPPFSSKRTTQTTFNLVSIKQQITWAGAQATGAPTQPTPNSTHSNGPRPQMFIFRTNAAVHMHFFPAAGSFFYCLIFGGLHTAHRSRW